MTNPQTGGGTPNGLVDVHTHVVPENFPSYIGTAVDSGWPYMKSAHACHRHVMVKGAVYRTVSHQCWDCNARVSDMSRTGVERQVLSPMPELLSYWFSAEDGSAMCRYLNEVIAGMVATEPGRFNGLGAVPLQDLDLAIKELEFAVKELKLSGVEVGTNVNDVSIADSRFDPFFEAAESLGAAIFVHPIRPAGVERLVGHALLQPAVAFPAETGLAAAAFVSAGTLQRYPRLRIALSHGGGTFASILPRLQYVWDNFPELQETIALQPRAAARMMFYDDLVYDAGTARHLIDVFGETQLMVGTDYPFSIMEKDPKTFTESLGLDRRTLRLVQSGNARRWLGIVES
jgi:aminocarboxymuconate-semialdehyde decarboxylase